jgi:hypothetical protein
MSTIIHRAVVIAVLVIGLLLASPYRRHARTTTLKPEEASPTAKIQLAADDHPSPGIRKLSPIEEWHIQLPAQSVVPPNTLSVAGTLSRRQGDVDSADESVSNAPRMLPPINQAPSPQSGSQNASRLSHEEARRLPSISEPTAQMTRQHSGRLTTHRIADGDDLRLLSGKYLQDESRFMEIYELNRQFLFRPDLLPIGVEIQVYDERD